MRKISAIPQGELRRTAMRRFSSTVSNWKMPRSSGTMASPAEVMRCAGSPVTSRPCSSTLPRRGVISPTADFSVVLLPAPLRPSRVTISPGPTSSVTPCRIWLLP